MSKPCCAADNREATTTSCPVEKDPAATSRFFCLSDLAVCRGAEGEQQETNQFGFNSSQILLSVNGEVFDVTSHPSGRGFYGPGRPYSLFAGCDATMALARSKLEPSLLNKFCFDELTEDERQTVAEWILKFRSKYRTVGRLQEATNCRLDLSRFNCCSMESY